MALYNDAERVEPEAEAATQHFTGLPEIGVPDAKKSGKFNAGPALTAAALLMALAVGVFLLFSGGSSGSDASPPGTPGDNLGSINALVDLSSTETLANLDTDPEAVMDEVFAQLLGPDTAPEESAALLSDLGQLLGASPGATADDVDEDSAAQLLTESILRRLDLDQADVQNQADLVALIAAELGEDSFDSPEDFKAALVQWLKDNQVNIVQLLGKSTSLADLNLDLMNMDFADVAAALETLLLTGEPIPLPLDAVGLRPITIPGITWDMDVATRTVSFSGNAVVLDIGGPAMVSLTWPSSGESPEVLAAWTVESFALSTFGVPGQLGDYQLPTTTLLLSDVQWVISKAQTAPAMLGFLDDNDASGTVADGPTTAEGGADGDSNIVQSGLSLLSSIPASALPDSAQAFVGGSGGTDRIGLSGSLGDSLSALAGGEAPTNFDLVATIPQLDAPDMPQWLTSIAGSPWQLSMTGEDSTYLVGLEGVVSAEMGGSTRRFAVALDLATDSATNDNSGNDSATTGTLVGQLVEPWDEPFDISWMTLDSAQLIVDLNETSTAALVTADTTVMGKSANITLEIDSRSDGTDAALTATLSSVTVDEIVGLIATETGATAPVEIPAIELTDVVASLTTGRTNSFTVAATASVGSQTVDVLAGVVSQPSGSGYGVIVGVGLDEWALTDLLPGLSDTVLEPIEFPPAALVLSNIDGTIPAEDMPAPMQQFFRNVGAAQRVDLQAGLGLVSSIDFTGTALEDVMGAMGFDDATFPVVGTLPIKALSGGGSSGGSAGLDGLQLRVALPEIAPAGAPDWFVSGQLSLVATGRPSLGIEGSMTVLVEGEELTFTVGAVFGREGAGYNLSLFGELGTERPWVEPFGIEWLTLERVAIELSITPTGSVGLGFAATAIIGDKDLDAAIKLELSPVGVPTNFILFVESDAGLSTTDLLKVQAQMASAAGAPVDTNFDNYPALSIRNLSLKFAPKGSAVLGVEQGFAVSGDAYATIGGEDSLLATLDLEITEDGLFAAGTLSAYQLGPLSWTDITIELELSRFDQRFFFEGGVELFGIQLNAKIDLSTKSIFFAGRQALEELRDTIELFERIARNPAGAISDLTRLLDDAGVPVPEWFYELTEALEKLQKNGKEFTSAAINTILNGGTISLTAFPVGGEDSICPLLAPIEVGGKCYTTPPIAAGAGVPNGGAAKVSTCPALAPFPAGQKCYLVVPGEFINTDGTPNGGVNPSDKCPPLNPIVVGGRCYTVPPTGAVPGLPLGGAARSCLALWPFMENGRCYSVAPSAASLGLTFPGLCTPFGISCDLDKLLREDIARLLFDRIEARFDDW